jgi:hypothetical protein
MAGPAELPETLTSPTDSLADMLRKYGWRVIVAGAIFACVLPYALLSSVITDPQGMWDQFTGKNTAGAMGLAPTVQNPWLLLAVGFLVGVATMLLLGIAVELMARKGGKEGASKK